MNLEFPHEKVNSFEIAIEGINGQLPNLDLVTTVFRLCRKEHIPASLHTEVTNYLNQNGLNVFQNWGQFVLLIHVEVSPAAAFKGSAV